MTARFFYLVFMFDDSRVISGSVSQQHGTSSGCGLRKGLRYRG